MFKTFVNSSWEKLKKLIAGLSVRVSRNESDIKAIDSSIKEINSTVALATKEQSQDLISRVSFARYGKVCVVSISSLSVKIDSASAFNYFTQCPDGIKPKFATYGMGHGLKSGSTYITARFVVNVNGQVGVYVQDGITAGTTVNYLTGEVVFIAQ